MDLIIVNDETDKETRGNDINYDKLVDEAQIFFGESKEFFWQPCHYGFGWICDTATKVRLLSLWRDTKDVFCRLYSTTKWTKEQKTTIEEFLRRNGCFIP